nr:zinc-regulated transporter 3 [Quercus suber]
MTARIVLTWSLACMVGASIICIDIVVRLFPGQKNFRIQDSDRFLSASLSLSFGVMLFSSLYSMLPSAKRSLESGGFSSTGAAWTLIACFLGGVLGIQVISRVMHSFIPSHVVDCEHQHDESARDPESHPGSESSDHTHTHAKGHRHEQSEVRRPTKSRQQSLLRRMDHGDSERKIRNGGRAQIGELASNGFALKSEDEVEAGHLAVPANSREGRRPTLPQRITSSINQLTSNDTSDQCDANGPCHGFTDPCGQDCFKSVNAKRGIKGPSKTGAGTRPPINKSLTTSATESTPLLLPNPTQSQRPNTAQTSSAVPEYNAEYDADLEEGPSDSASTAYEPNALQPSKTTSSDDSQQSPADHHHHVPTNAFLSIGLQTSIAIALHKLPEGFITYATNHANPKLGVSVFLALFIHNITEGFAMALPLYLAINNRLKAMLISFVLGGFSQPLGAGVAALWFKIAGNGDWAPSESVYGGMFAVTAGIMASVALQLFSEALDLTHSRTLCMVGAFTGMGILGISSALTA